MKLKDIALLTEIVGGAGILISLLVLVFEVRQNNALVERQILLDRADLDASIIESQYLPPIIAKIQAVQGVLPVESAFSRQYELSEEEAIRWSRLLRRDWNNYEADFDAGLPGADSEILTIMQFADQRLYWTAEKSKQETKFVEYVRDLIE